VTSDGKRLLQAVSGQDESLAARLTVLLLISM